MKKIRALIVVLTLLFAVLLLASCEKMAVSSAEVNEKGELILTYQDGTTAVVEQYKVIVDASMNEDGHLILTYSDGTTEDRGFQTIPKVTVTFVDYNGTVLSVQKTYRGLDVTAPADPVREDHIFAGWDKSFDAVMSDITVTATYTAKEAYTVTFKDYDGTVLKTENVTHGKDATPPTAPSRDGYNFTGWLGDYTAITQNTEIVASYVEKGVCVVTFLDYNGRVLGTAETKEGGSVTAPVEPTRDGYTFERWSSSLSGITSNKSVTAQYTLIPGENILDFSYRVSGNTVTLTLSLAGDVCLASFQGTLAFEGMTATAVNDVSTAVFSYLHDDGVIATVYTTTKNQTTPETVLTVTLTKTAAVGRVILTLTETCLDEDGNAKAYTVIGENLAF